MGIPGFASKITAHLAAHCTNNTRFSLKKELISTINGLLHYFSKSKVSYPGAAMTKLELPKKSILGEPMNNCKIWSKRRGFINNPFLDMEACNNKLSKCSCNIIKMVKMKFENGKCISAFWAQRILFNLPHTIPEPWQVLIPSLGNKTQQSLFSWKMRPAGSLCNIQMRYYSTTQTCLPSPAPPPNQKCVIPPKKKEVCLSQKQFQWQPVETIKMPCCCCPTKDVQCITDVQPKINLCKKIEYRIPAFSECKRSALLKIQPKECCFEKTICPMVGKQPEFITTKMRQEMILGRHKKNSVLSRKYSTNSARKENTNLKSQSNECNNSN